MPGRVFITSSMDEIASSLGATCDLTDPGPRMDAAPGETFAVLTGPPRALQEMRWQMIMTGRRNARGRPVMETIVNARSETVFEKSAFEDVGRAILPVNGWYEWTGQRGRKTRWQISAPDQPLLLFAAIFDIWTAPGGLEVAQMATLTVEPNADVADYHHRMPALLSPEDVDPWLTGPRDAASALLKPAENGTLVVEKSDLA